MYLVKQVLLAYRGPDVIRNNCGCTNHTEVSFVQHGEALKFVRRQNGRGCQFHEWRIEEELDGQTP